MIERKYHNSYHIQIQSCRIKCNDIRLNSVLDVNKQLAPSTLTQHGVSCQYVSETNANISLPNSQ